VCSTLILGAVVAAATEGIVLGDQKRHLNDASTLAVLSLYVLIVGFAGVALADRALNKHFEVYSEGITIPRSPLNFLHKTRFVPYLDISGYYVTGGGSRCIVLLRVSKDLIFRHSEEAITALSKALREAGVAEVE
jgi:hypothetical protein